MTSFLKYILSGAFFGFLLVKSEVVSWFRIQEMFRFDSFHMYGIFISAIAVAMVSIRIIRYFNVRDLEGNPIRIDPKDPTMFKRYLFGGTIFGLGWALTGACPGPLYALAGAGYIIFLVPIASALFGTWVYGRYRDILPH